MTNDKRNPKPQCRNILSGAIAGFVIRISSFLRIWSFVIRVYDYSPFNSKRPSANSWERPEAGGFMRGSIDEHEFVAVQDQPAKVGQTVLLHIGFKLPDFLAGGRPIERQFAGERHAVRYAWPLRFQPRSQAFGVMGHESIVPQGQRLLNGHAGVAGRGELIAGGTIERVHERVRQGAKQKPIDAA